MKKKPKSKLWRQGPEEKEKLARFWNAVISPLSRGERTSERRLMLLKTYAAIQVEGGGNSREHYNRLKRRGKIEKLPTNQQCFACLFPASAVWHHVIQIQHGGSNHPNNRVPLCDGCHAKIHPWLEAKAVLTYEQVKPVWA